MRFRSLVLAESAASQYVQPFAWLIALYQEEIVRLTTIGDERSKRMKEAIQHRLSDIRTIVNSAQSFGRRDRAMWYIMWYLNEYLIMSIAESADAFLRENPTFLKARADAVAFKKQVQPQYRLIPGRFTISMKHFFGIPEQRIQNFNFTNWREHTPHNILVLFTKWENEWKKQTSGTVRIEEEPVARPIIRFPNGWVWILLDRPSCEEEADAMRHCGNAGGQHTDRILSLREPVEIKGQKRWRPMLTFIIDGNGRLGEMKAKANQKPPQEFHPFIIELLKNSIVKGIKGGGYKPENNFAMADLSERDLADLMTARPDLF